VLKFIRYDPINAAKVARLQRTLSGLNDKNIVIIHETFLHEEEGGRRYLVIVTEFFRKGSLLRKIKAKDW
jgi:hypothetical protein